MRRALNIPSVVLILAVPAVAQEGTKSSVEGSVTAGYRFTDVKGYEPKFEELYDLKSGFRIMDLNLFGKGPSRYADRYSATLSGLGGDPYSTAQFTVQKNSLYDLRVTFRQSRYYWNRNDQAILPNGLNGLTSNHDWATVRKLGSANLVVRATRNLRFTFEFYRNSRDGVNFTTRSLDYFGASSTWGSFARGNPYYVVAPLQEAAYRGTAGIDYTSGGWNFHYRAGYQSFADSVRGINAASQERSINVDDPGTAREPVNSISWRDSRELKTPVSEFSYTGRPVRLETRGGYLFYRYAGPASLDMSMDGIARTNTAGTTVGPYAISETSRAHVTEPNHVLDQGFTYKATEWWNLMMDYRYSRFTVDSVADFQSVNGTTVITGDSTSQWRVGIHTLDFNMAFTPASTLLVRTGLRLLKSDIEALEDGQIDVQRTKRIRTVWPVASLYYQPSKMLTVRGNIEQMTNGSSYTRVTPHIDIGGRVFARFKPTEKFYLDNAVVVRNRRLMATDYRSTIRSNAVKATYEVNPRLSAFGGFSYDSFFASDFVNFLRGPAPITGVILRDQTVDRVWQAGINAKPTPRVGVSFAGNYVRATGMGEITGETPLYGPIRFPYATGTIYYDFPRAGRLTVLLQRTYYSEQIVAGNNFGAHILTICWTKGF
jgi:hypothetical protein